MHQKYFFIVWFIKIDFVVCKSYCEYILIIYTYISNSFSRFIVEDRIGLVVEIKEYNFIGLLGELWNRYFIYNNIAWEIYIFKHKFCVI